MKYYSIVNSIVIYIESRIRTEISYVDLEKATGFSLVHIRSIFKDFFKIPLARYILQRKIANAAYEIRYSKKRITDIAYSYGFDGYDSFTRAFKRILGITPREYRVNPHNVFIGYISSGVYAPMIHKKVGEIMEKDLENKSSECILFGVPSVDFGYGVNSTFPACLKACLDYLGQKINYDYIMTACGAAFRLRWNTEKLDLGNVGIMNLYEDNYKAFNFCFNSAGRNYSILKRDSNTSKSDFINFITGEIDRGKPCIALGIVGPPEACVITGYQKNGEVLLGYSMFQNEPQFCKNTVINDAGYFVCSDWWENSETRAVMSIGEYNNSMMDLKSIIGTAINVLSSSRINQYAGGQAAYDAVIDFINDDRNWSEKVLKSRLYEQVIAYGDVMVMMCNRNSAGDFFEQYEHKNKEITSRLVNIGRILKSISKIPEEMTAIPGGWDMSERMLESICRSDIRKQITACLVNAKKLEKNALGMLNDLMQTSL